MKKGKVAKPAGNAPKNGALAPLTVTQSVLNTHDKNKKAVPAKQAKKKGPATVSNPVKSNASSAPVVVKQLSLTELAESRLLLPAHAEGIGCGVVKIRFNHYNKAFPIHNGVLKWTDVDEEYCLSFAYKGDYTRDLYQNVQSDAVESNHPKTAAPKMTQIYALRDEKGVYFLDLVSNDQYMLQLTEDPNCIDSTPGKPKPTFTATELEELNPDRKVAQANRAVQLITDELKGMKTSDLGGAQAKDLIERRDLEDILFSGSGGAGIP